MYKSRIFSNHNDVSFNDYIANKRRSAMTHPELQKKILLNNYYASFSCDASPMKIVDAPTSYTCNNNKTNLLSCKNIKNVLYPYGNYMCRNDFCNTCINTGKTLENSNNNVALLTTTQSTQNEYDIYDLYAEKP